MAQAPVIPPRPTRGQDERGSGPKIPPRPIKGRGGRSISPGDDRYAPSPLNENPLSKSPKAIRFALDPSSESLERPGSVSMPSVGEEGMEYAAVSDDGPSEAGGAQQTSTVGADVKLYAPKPSLPALSAKQRVAAVTRTDSDRAAQFGIGRPSLDEQVHPSKGSSIKKKGSTASALSETDLHEDEHGIPEIGQQVPMYPNAGDVQAPSPAPDNLKPRHHGRRTSARGFVELPPGSYGLHGHGVVPQDKLHQAYYEKHPSLHKKEKAHPLHERYNDFARSSDELNSMVRSTVNGKPRQPRPLHLCLVVGPR